MCNKLGLGTPPFQTSKMIFMLPTEKFCDTTNLLTLLGNREMLRKVFLILVGQGTAYNPLPFFPVSSESAFIVWFLFFSF